MPPKAINPDTGEPYKDWGEYDTRQRRIHGQNFMSSDLTYDQYGHTNPKYPDDGRSRNVWGDVKDDGYIHD